MPNKPAGLSSADELLTLAQAGVASLNVSYNNLGTAVASDAQGNQHQQTGSFTSTAGTTQQMHDVWFSVNTANTINLNPVAISVDIAALPQISGMGNVASLHQAMAQDSSGVLQGLVQQWKNANAADRPALLTSLIYHWAGVQDMVSPPQYALGDAKTLATLEKYLARNYIGIWGGSQVGPAAARILLQAFDELQRYVPNQLLIQTDLQSLLSTLGIAWVEQNVTFELNVQHIVQQFHAEYLADPLAVKVAILNFGMVMRFNGDLGTQVLAALRTAALNEQREFAQLLVFADKTLIAGTENNDGLSASPTNFAVYIQGFGGNDHLTGNSQDDVLEGGRAMTH